MNKKQRSIAAVVFTAILFMTNITLPRAGGGGGGRGGSRGGGAGARGGGGGGRSFSGGGRSAGGNRSGFSGNRGGGANRGNNANRGNAGRRGNTTNVNVSGGGYGRGGYYGGGAGWVAPVLATTAIAGTAIAAGSASSSANAANRAAGSAEQSAQAANRAADNANMSRIQPQPSRDMNNNNNAGRQNRIGNIGRAGAGQSLRQPAPASPQAAASATQNARPVSMKNPQRVNREVSRQARIDSRRGNTSQINRPSRFYAGGRRAYGFYNNGNFYATWFWGGIPYYWYGGMWTPWTSFWSLYPWWYDYYYTKGQDGMSFYDCDNNYDCPDGDCPPACQRYYN